jgi:4-amino-4-deoxy-L-arabinose transferase-like glycosyltransferase
MATPRTRNWLLLLGIVVVVACLRIALLDVPLERDEGEYAYAARLLLDGVPPYAEAYNMKLPGIYAIYAMILVAFGASPSAIHLALLCVNALTIVLVYGLAARLFDARVGLGAAAAFGLLSLSTAVQGLWANAEMFVLPFAIAGLWLLADVYRRERGPRLRRVALAGLLLGAGCIVKQHGVFLAAAGGMMSLLAATKAGPGERREHALAIGVLVAAGITPWLITCLVMVAAGVFDGFWFWTIEYARAYTGLRDSGGTLSRFVEGVTPIANNAPLVWSIAGVGLVLGFRRPAWRDAVVFVVAFATLSLASVFPGLYFRPHYFVLVLPAVAIAFGVALAAIEDVAAERGMATSARGLAIGLGVLALGHVVWTERAPLFEQSPHEITQDVYGPSPFSESLMAADILKARARPGDRVAVLGSEPQIPFYAGLRKASGFLYVYPLMETHAYASEMQRRMIDEIESADPRFFVFVSVPASWLRGPESDTHILGWMNQFVRGYRLVGRIAIYKGPPQVQVGDDLESSACPSECVDIFERIDSRT